MIKFLKNNSLPVLFMLVTSYSTFAQAVKEKSPAEYVNPYMGNISHMLVPTYPTIHMPNSMLRVYPERSDYNGDLLNGLPLMITSHRGSSAFNLSPFQGALSDIKPVIKFSYDLEEIHPYSYHVYLDEQETTVDYGLASQSAKYTIHFEKEKESHLILNSRNGMLTWDGEAIAGYQIIGNNTKVYIYLIPKQKPEKVQVLDENTTLISGTKAEGRNASIVLSFSKSQSNLELPYGVSFINEQQAKSNYQREIKGRTVAELQEQGKQIWDEALGKMQVEGGSEADKNVFYTSLYRSYERPVCISEDGRYYSAFDGQVHQDNGRPFYTDDWIWDSYRAHHPLRVLLNPKQEEDIIHSFILMAQQMEHNWLPTFPEVTGDSRRMNSNHGVATILDASEKGLDNFDLEKAYQASKAAITEKTLAPWSGKPAGELDNFYKRNGFIPALRDGEEETIPEVSGFEKRQPVAVTLGTAYDEWCLAVLANKLDHKNDYKRFIKEALNYRNLFRY